MGAVVAAAVVVAMGAAAAAAMLFAGVVAVAATEVLGAPALGVAALAVGEGVVFFSSTGTGSVRASRKSWPNFRRSVPVSSRLPT